MTHYDSVADLPLTVTGHALVRHERSPTPEFTRASTVVELHSDGVVGRGEDVTYETGDHDAFEAHDGEGAFDFTFEGTFGGFSAFLDGVDLHPTPPEREVSRDYRRWALESAALDLALRQGETNLGTALGRAYEPVRFVVSSRVESMDRIDTLLSVDPDAEFKLDPEPEWDDALYEALSDLGRVRVADLKGFYEGTVVDTPADPAFYKRTLEAFPDAVIEDARSTDQTRELLEGNADRLSWDAPIHGVADVEALPVSPRWLNIKPSRFGTVASLFECLEYCEAHGITPYGGGQYELDVGRDHVQVLASLFYPDSPNDVAPRDYNEAEPPMDLPRSPLEPPAMPTGLGWD
jgi:hypothetical protein